MKKFLLLLSVLFVVSCSKDSEDSSQKFRSIYNNTVWVTSSGDTWITFSPDKIFSQYFFEAGTGECTFWKIGKYDNVDYDGCTYDTAEYVLVQEDNDTFIVRQTISSGTNNSNGKACGNGESSTLTIQVMNDNKISMSLEYDNGYKSVQNLIKTVEAFAGNNCIEATLNQGLW